MGSLVLSCTLVVVVAAGCDGDDERRPVPAPPPPVATVAVTTATPGPDEPEYRRPGSRYRFVRTPIVVVSGGEANLFVRVNRPLGLGDGRSGAYFALDGVSDPNGPFRAWQWPGCYTQHYSDMPPPRPGKTAEVRLELKGRTELRVHVKVRRGTGGEDTESDLRSRYLRELGCRRR